jgi:hypothetical protein
MADEFSAFFENNDNNIEITPNIDFHIDKYESFECFKNKNIKPSNLFATESFIENIINIFKHDCDIPLIIHGTNGIGKLTSIIGLINNIPCYLPDYNITKKVNNLEYFKICDREYNKILSYENIFYLNLNIFNNDNNLVTYLKYIFKLSRSRSFQTERKIFIVKGIDYLPLELQKYVSFMIDRLNGASSFIFIVHNPFNLQLKIRTTCVMLHYNHLTKDAFTKKFEYNFKNLLTDKEWIHKNDFYKIYTNNKYNIGNTIAFIKYIKATEQITPAFFKDKDNYISLTAMIVNTFVKKCLVLSTLDRLQEVRKFVYLILSINLPPLDIVKTICKKLMKSKLSVETKRKILTHVTDYSKHCNNANKEVIPLETLFFNLILIIYA